MRNKKLIALFIVLCSLAVLVLINSVLFSVQHVNAYCFNGDDAALEQEVLSVNGVKKGRSIFFLNENEVIRNVEQGVKDKNVRVINIEKKFPNIIYINYVEVEEYLKIESGGKIYYLSNSAVVMRIQDAAEPQSALIRLEMKGNVLNENAGEELKSSDENDIIRLKALLSSLERIMYRGTALGLIESISLCGENVSTKGYMYVHMASGVYWEFQNTVNLLEKFKLAYGLYQDYPDTAPELLKGTLIMTGATKAEAKYSPYNRYKNGVNADT